MSTCGAAATTTAAAAEMFTRRDDDDDDDEEDGRTDGRTEGKMDEEKAPLFERDEERHRTEGGREEPTWMEGPGSLAM